MNERVIIRTERPEDRGDIRRVLIDAFRDAPMSDHQEHLLVERLRQSEAFVPELSLVAEWNGKPVGYVLLTEVPLESPGENRPILLLAPLAVHPFCQRAGIGGRLMEAAHLRARERRYDAVILAGDPCFYGRFDYRAAAEYGIRLRADIPSNFVLVRPLTSEPLPTGRVALPPEFES